MSRSERVKCCLDLLTEGGFDPFLDSDGTITFNVHRQSFSLLMTDGLEDYIPSFFVFRGVDAERELETTAAVEPEDNLHFWRCSDCNVTFAHLGPIAPLCPACGGARCMTKGSTRNAEKAKETAVAA